MLEKKLHTKKNDFARVSPKNEDRNKKNEKIYKLSKVEIKEKERNLNIGRKIKQYQLTKSFKPSGA